MVVMLHAPSGTLQEPFDVVEIVALDIAELELQLQVDVVIGIAPPLTFYAIFGRHKRNYD